MALATLLLIVLVRNPCIVALAAAAPAFFVFGDSSVDTGNNNFISTLIKANSLPYGMNFDPPGATGRFSNGKLVSDYIAEFLDLPYPVNFLDPGVSPWDFLKGVNFAAAGAGLLDSTGFSRGVRSFTKQIKEFQKVVKVLESLAGKSSTLDLLSRSIFIISFAGNDLAANYQLNPFRQMFYNLTQFESLLINQMSRSIQTLHAYGAQKFIIADIPPLGCTPVELILHGACKGRCVASVNEKIRSFNSKTSVFFSKLRAVLKDCDFLHLKSYTIVQRILENPSTHGLRHASRACCGNGGHYNALGPCNWFISSVCEDPDLYAFWDMVHPTQALYKLVANEVIFGSPNSIYPFNLAHLVSNMPQ
ncbi:hypothetical protein SELMODRAFT_118198 [Selaginella moellendorffii]|uniref:Uncharacterized protein n=1 Tax=Selaginella moellendorffii TaxID=88036 RepID=D8SIQ3_SELML|nr:GDSL esterase/lipase At1g71250 [Selaginella moellendorffii]EFJ15537.1 hypothetical protein SELMODRAFT_118198 [Selaginella moellendorffii]|eukprot:XP_002983195.1 GDSL esterase/lipase At1g71250 [Selaginella moellendorffii]